MKIVDAGGIYRIKQEGGGPVWQKGTSSFGPNVNNHTSRGRPPGPVPFWICYWDVHTKCFSGLSDDEKDKDTPQWKRGFGLPSLGSGISSSRGTTGSSPSALLAEMRAKRVSMQPQPPAKVGQNVDILCKTFQDRHIVTVEQTDEVRYNLSVSP